jgi:CHAT domain-containing protein
LDFAREAHRAACALYQIQLTENKKPPLIEMGLERSGDAVLIFEENGRPFEAAKANYMHSIFQGMLGHSSKSNQCARRCVDLLSPLVEAHADGSGGMAKWLLQGLRALAENGETPAKRLECCSRGFKLLDGNFRGVKRDLFRAQLLRAEGSALVRLRPRTREGLERAIESLRGSIELFSNLRNGGKFILSKAKAMRELARALRAYSVLGERSGRLEEAAEVLRRSILLYEKAEDESKWNHFHLAKILRDQGDLPGAMEQCLRAVEILESDRESLNEDENRISYLSDNLAIYDLGIFLAHELGRASQGLALSRRCKARVFVERLPGFGREGVSDTVNSPADGTALVEYHAGVHGLSIFALTRAGLLERRVAVPQEKLALKVRTLQGFLRQPSTQANAHRCACVLGDLSRWLIDPVLGHLSGCENLVVVPSGPLAELSFCALPVEGAPLIERFNLSYLPHAAMGIVVKRGCSSGRVVVLANARGDLEHAEEEAREIAAIFPGAEVYIGPAAGKAALGKTAGSRYLHVACHGEFTMDDPMGSRLILSPEGGDDGVLRAAEISGLPLEGLDLAFLSCCKSARGWNKGGDEIEGVHRAFLRAGARSVVVSLWDIEDRTTRILVGAFYRGLAGGVKKSRALREAQLELIRNGHGHPYYWAAFKLVGSGD